MQDFTKLKVWEKAHALTLAVYRISNPFPQHETLGLRSQMRRAAFMIPAKIAEGCGQTAPGAMSRALSLAVGCASELQYVLLLCHDLGYLKDEEHTTLTKDVVEVRRMLAGLLHKFESEN